MATHTRKLVVINNCVRECPHAVSERTPGAGYAEDYFCKKVVDKGKRRKIIGYVEWPSELPKDGVFPDWCPLYEAEPGLYEETKKSKK